MTVIVEPVNTPAGWDSRAWLEESWQACGWSQEGQLDRHVAVVAALAPEPGDLLLDWGCGTGDLVQLLPDDVKYVGYDWSGEMIRRAQRDHDHRRAARFQNWQPAGRCDLVACVGPFNLPGGWTKERTWHTLRHLWDQTYCRTMAVSLYCGDDALCLSYTGAEAARAGAQLGYHVSVDQIRENDLLLVVRR